MSVLLFTIAAISVAAAGLKHPAEVAAFASNPRAFVGSIHPSTLPWKQVLYTGLLSTDVALWLEVSSCGSLLQVGDASLSLSSLLPLRTLRDDVSLLQSPITSSFVHPNKSFWRSGACILKDAAIC